MKIHQFALSIALAASLLWGGPANATIATAVDGSVRWQMDSFRAFAEGTLPDGGVNIYPAADGSLRLINAFDLNQDGRPDIFLPSNHAYSEKVDLTIYWNRDGYDIAHVTRLPTAGGKDAAVADLNHDGAQDLVVANGYDGTRTELELWIYWGGSDGYSSSRRTALPTQGAEAVAIGDLNGDGWPEIVVANNGRTYHVAIDRTQESYIYWNDKGHFSTERKTILPTINGRAVAIADLNQDSAPDLVFVSAGNEPDEAGARIFWSLNGNFDGAHSTFLPGEGCSAITVGDLNNDHRPDLVLVNAERLKGREGGIYNIVGTVQLDSFIYWNSSTGFAATRRTGLPTVAGRDAAIGDLDGDGWPEVIFANSQGDSSYVYWGSAEGFQSRRRLALPTHNASAVVAADLKHSGHTDLIFANFNLGRTMDTDSYIYWGGIRGPEVTRRTGLPTSGASAIVVADLAGTGRNDLVFINQQDGTGSETPASLYLSDPANPLVFSPTHRIDVDTRGPDSYSSSDMNLDGWPDLVVPGTDGVSIYWNSAGSFGRQNRTAIFDHYAFSTRLADFNRDGYIDLLPSEWSPGSTETHIYYGGPGGFSKAASTALPVSGIRFHTIADLNGDGWLDVAFPLFSEALVAIFWNGPDGFSPSHRTNLPGRSTVALEVADLNADGHLDLIVPNLLDPNPTIESRARAFGGSPDGGVFIYWGTKTGFDAEHRTLLPAIGAEDVAVADFNRDGRLDLAVSSYHGGVRRDFPSYIYWQGRDGFSPENVSMIETYSASGILATDFNADGWPDLLFANHHRDGSHRTNTFLYWGGPAGFSPKHRLELPSRGPHLMTVTDMGNIYDRSTSYCYISPARNFPNSRQLKSIDWKADVPPGTVVRLQLRSAHSLAALATAEWEGPTGINSSFATPAPANMALHGSWVQFQVIMENPGGGLPVVRRVTLDLD